MHGNIKTKTETPIDKQGNEIAQSQNGLVGYRKSIQFAYNPNNELKQTITIIDTGLQVQRITTQYHYDAFGRRIAKNSKVERLNKLNQRGELVRYPTVLMHLSKTQKTVQQTTLMLWEGNRQIQEYTDQLIFTTVYDQSFEPVARIVQTRNPIESDNIQETFKVYHYHNNHLGTPQELTNELGEVVWCNYEYAWGGTYQSYYKEQSLNNCAIIETDLQPIRFQGQSYDVETGLHYNRFRYYDSDVGMFIQRDPIGLLGGINIYQYADNPVMWIDPFGLNRFKKTQWQAPTSGTGYNYTVYQQDIDWDLVVKGETNLSRASRGGSPYIIKNGKPSQIQLHHSRQNARGSLFEISTKTHQAKKGQGREALHPYGSKKHPEFPVDRDDFGKDRQQYWIDRANREQQRRDNLKNVKC